MFKCMFAELLSCPRPFIWPCMEFSAWGIMSALKGS